jgi:hypothetical protein
MVDPVFKPVQVSVGAAAAVGAAVMATATAPVTNADVMYFSLIRMVALFRWGRLSHSRVALGPAPVVTAGARNLLLGSWSLCLPVSTQRSCEALNGGLLITNLLNVSQECAVCSHALRGGDWVWLA